MNEPAKNNKKIQKFPNYFYKRGSISKLCIRQLGFSYIKGDTKEGGLTQMFFFVVLTINFSLVIANVFFYK